MNAAVNAPTNAAILLLPPRRPTIVADSFGSFAGGCVLPVHLWNNASSDSFNGMANKLFSHTIHANQVERSLNSGSEPNSFGFFIAWMTSMLRFIVLPSNRSYPRARGNRGYQPERSSP